MRLDLWLWSTRVFKTRSNAVEAIRGGGVTVNGAQPKPARDVHPGDLIVATVGRVTRTLRALGSPKTRVGAALVKDYADDLTPPEAYAKPAKEDADQIAVRPRGSGRPTKRDRRQIDALED
jgi:ribosome-associated heat shock protein Hsp15